MVFTVDMPGGARNFEFEAYLRHLKKQGGNMADTPRVLAPQTRGRWLVGWESRAEAEAFAVGLRESSEMPNWQVYPSPSAELTRGPLGPLEILVRRTSEGCSYSLSPTSWHLLKIAYPDVLRSNSVFISADPAVEFEAIQGNYWDYIARILTGLTEEQMQPFGGYRIIDSKQKRVYHDIPLIAG